MSAGLDRKARAILEHIRINPGCTIAEIGSRITGSPSVIRSIVFQLGAANLVENREDVRLEPRWYAIEIPADALYLELAEKLLKEMDALPSDQRKAFLAKRLEELRKP